MNCYKCVEDFQKAPEGASPEELMALQDCPESMMAWAASHLKLAMKLGSGEAASSNVRNLDVRKEDQLASDILDEADRRLAGKKFRTCHTDRPPNSADWASGVLHWIFGEPDGRLP